MLSKTFFTPPHPLLCSVTSYKQACITYKVGTPLSLFVTLTESGRMEIEIAMQNMYNDQNIIFSFSKNVLLSPLNANNLSDLLELRLSEEFFCSKNILKEIQSSQYPIAKYSANEKVN